MFEIDVFVFGVCADVFFGTEMSEFPDVWGRIQTTDSQLAHRGRLPLVSTEIYT